MRTGKLVPVSLVSFSTTGWCRTWHLTGAFSPLSCLGLQCSQSWGCCCVSTRPAPLISVILTGFKLRWWGQEKCLKTITLMLSALKIDLFSFCFPVHLSIQFLLRLFLFRNSFFQPMWGELVKEYRDKVNRQLVSPALRDQTAGFQSQLQLPLVVGLWQSHFTSLCFSFPIYKESILIFPICRIIGRTEIINMH